MDSKVFRPITMMWPVVSCLNHLKSSGKCHGILFPAPITRLSDIAAMALKCFMEFLVPAARRAKGTEYELPKLSRRFDRTYGRVEQLIPGVNRLATFEAYGQDGDVRPKS